MQETEIEFKNMLTKNEFDALNEAFFQDINAFKQTNFYIDSDNYDLIHKHLMLRVRVKNDQYILTLKVPTDEHTVEEFHHVLNHPVEIGDEISKDMLSREIFLIIRSQMINRTLRVVGKLTTFRKEINYNGGTLVLDYSTYLNQSDYEIEYEASDVSEGKKTFNALLKQFNIKPREKIVKSERFYRALQNKRGE